MKPSTLALLITTCLLTSACTHYGRTFQQTSDTKSLRLALLHEIKPGDRIEHIRNILGPGKPATEKQQQDLLASYHRWQTKYGNQFNAPDGIATTDVFLFYPYGKNAQSSIYLQFRYDRLINHNPDEFKDADALSISVNLGSG